MEEEKLEWMDLDAFEASIPEEEWKSLSETIRDVNEEIADDISRHRQREMQDYFNVKDKLVPVGGFIPECQHENMIITEKTPEYHKGKCPDCGYVHEWQWTDWNKYGQRR